MVSFPLRLVWPCWQWHLGMETPGVSNVNEGCSYSFVASARLLRGLLAWAPSSFVSHAKCVFVFSATCWLSSVILCSKNVQEFLVTDEGEFPKFLHT